MKIRFMHPTVLRMEARPGDEVSVRAMTTELEALLASRRLDGEPVAVLVNDSGEEVAVSRRDIETAAVRSGRRGRDSHAAVS